MECDKCKKKGGQLNLDRESKRWVCNKCFYEKDNTKSSRGIK